MEQSKLADYNLWANDKARKLLSSLTEDELNRHILPPYNSIRNLISHIVLAVEYNLTTRVDGEKADADASGNRMIGWLCLNCLTTGGRRT